MKRRERIRNAARARQSFVTRRAELKLSALAELFKSAAGGHWVRTGSGVLQRELFLTGLPCLRSLRLLYHWENRFFSVNYNLQLLSLVPADGGRFTETGSCRFTLRCAQRGLRGARQYTWHCENWEDGGEQLDAYRERLQNPLILQRLDVLDILEAELRHDRDSGLWQISCESLIGSSTWLLIPPVLSMITPRREECVKFLELFELIADAVVNNRCTPKPEASPEPESRK